MNKKLLILLPLILSVSMAKTVQPKEMHAHDSNSDRIYDHSVSNDKTQDRVISSTADASAQITIMTTLQVSSEIISGAGNSQATMSFLDKNRMQISEDIAQGRGEHLSTLLNLMGLKANDKGLDNLQQHFSELTDLEHDAFLEQLKVLV